MPYATRGILIGGIHKNISGTPLSPCQVEVPLHAGDFEGVRGAGGTRGFLEALLFIAAPPASRPLIHPVLLEILIGFVFPAQKERS